MNRKKRLLSRMQKKMHKLAQSNLASTRDGDLYQTLNENEAFLRDTFSDCADLVIRRFYAFHSFPCMVAYLEVLIDEVKLDEILLREIMIDEPVNTNSPVQFATLLTMKLIPTGKAEIVGQLNDAVQRMIKGEVILLIESSSQAVSVNIPGRVNRTPQEPNTEPVIRGPRLGFVENLFINLTLLRQYIHTPQLKIVKYTLGEVTQTDVAIAYIENIAPANVVEEAKKRVSSIRIDSVLESGYIEELISDKYYSPFPLIQNTERSDSVAAALIEGKVAILTHGTPMVLLAPVTFWYGFETAEDYYINFIFGTMLRWLRYLFALVAMTLPSIYVAITTFHHEMIPTSLALSIAAAREVVPFPAALETLIMEVTFEALREAGLRLPRPVGQTISIVGGLVIGEAAVQAGIISAPIVIIVALTGIATFLITQSNMSQAISIIRFPMILLASVFGLYGIGAGLLAVLIHLVTLRSFGVPYLSPVSPLNPSGIWDTVIRAPWRVMLKRQQYTKQKLELGKK